MLGLQIPTTARKFLYPAGRGNVIWANTTIKGVNHAEERNHPNTKREFDAVLNGRSYLPDVFDKNR